MLITLPYLHHCIAKNFNRQLASTYRELKQKSKLKTKDVYLNRRIQTKLEIEVLVLVGGRESNGFKYQQNSIEACVEKNEEGLMQAEEKRQKQRKGTKNRSMKNEKNPNFCY